MDTPKKPFYKKWWFWLVAIIVLGIIGSAGSEPTNKQGENKTAVTADKSEETKAVVPEQKSQIDQLWIALDQSLRTRRGFDIKFDASSGLVTLTDDPSTLWDASASVRRAYSDLVWFGAKAFDIDGVQNIKVVVKGSFTDQYGKESSEDAVRLVMNEEEYRKYEWKNLTNRPIWQQMKQSATEYYMHPAIVKAVELDKLFLETR